MRSDCCSASLKKEPQAELYHGSDDDYELVIPFLVCSKCGKIQLKPVETEYKQQFVPAKEGVRKYA